MNIPALNSPVSVALAPAEQLVDESPNPPSAMPIVLRNMHARMDTEQALLPLVVDLDGTLTYTDTLAESLIQMVKRNPLTLLLMVYMLAKGRAAFKAWVSTRALINASVLPYRRDFVAYLEAEKERGRVLILATAAHISIAERVFAHFSFFDAFISTNGDTNMKGANKLAAIKRIVGKEFIYAGDSTADLKIWREASAAVLVSASSTVARRAALLTKVERVFPPEHGSARVWLKALRVHQWLKNALLFVPLLTAFSFFRMSDVLAVATAFVSFSMAASATYIVNDLWDLESDRQHPRKRFRPFANATLSIGSGVIMSVALMATAFLIATWVSKPFLLFLILYVVLTSAYSLVLKAYMMLDVLVLSLLYTLRILSGAAAINIPTSEWLLAFSMFIFLSLALVKRCSELVSMKIDSRAGSPGRDYQVSDLAVLLPMGVATTACSVVIFGLFIQSAETKARYVTPQMLWATAFLLCYWLFRLWIKTTRGEMHDDPVVYAMTDRGSRLTVIAIVGTILLAHFTAFMP